MKRLQDNINSKYIESANRLRPRHARQRIVAYVESYDDVFFWRSVLQEFEDDRFYFEVMLPSRTTLGKGKKVALTNQLGSGLGGYMIACVDADYDWLMQGRTEISRKICNNPYIFHTYVYAIENYQCYAPGLHTACVMSTLNDRQIIDVEAFLTEYSRIIWPLLVWSVWTCRYNRAQEFGISNFCDTVSFHDINLRRAEECLAQVRRRVNKTIARLQRHFPEGKKTYAPLREELERMGLSADTAYLYMRGHTLFDNVVIPLLTPVCNALRREREKEISDLALHRTQKQNEWSSYQNSQSPVEMMLKKSTGYKESAPYQSVREDIKRLMAEIGRQK